MLASDIQPDIWPLGHQANVGHTPSFNASSSTSRPNLAALWNSKADQANCLQLQDRTVKLHKDYLQQVSELAGHGGHIGEAAVNLGPGLLPAKALAEQLGAVALHGSKWASLRTLGHGPSTFNRKTEAEERMWNFFGCRNGEGWGCGLGERQKMLSKLNWASASTV